MNWSNAEQCSAPFPHVVVDGFIDPETVQAINDEWPDDWQKERGKNNHKWNTQALPPTARALVEGIDLFHVEKLTGISGLIADPQLFGAGLHCIPPGGFLRMHVDFNRHPVGWHRRVNLLIYLNRRWRDDWQGHLQLGMGNHAKRIAPIGGRAVIFETNESSWHGHPEPLACPDDVQRRSLALYFYTPQPPPTAPHTTIYR